MTACLRGWALIERTEIVPELFGEHDSWGTALDEPTHHDRRHFPWRGPCRVDRMVGRDGAAGAISGRAMPGASGTRLPLGRSRHARELPSRLPAVYSRWRVTPDAAPGNRGVRISPLVGALLVVSIGASACGENIVATPSPTTQSSLPGIGATPPVAPSSELRVFTSSTYAYSIAYPSNWSVRNADEELESFQAPHDYSPGTDYFSATAPDISDPGLIVAGPAVEDGTTLDEWVATFQGFVRSVILCGPADEQVNIQLGGEPGRLLTWTTNCNEFLMWAGAVRGGHAYHVIWVNNYATDDPAAQAADRRLFQEILATFTFRD